MIGALFRLVFQTLVDLAAAFLSAVLSHEDVQAAGARMMVRAMNEFLRQPDLNEHVRCMSETMSKNQEDYARSAGQDFPKLAGHFIQGVFSPKKHQQQQQVGVSSKQQQQVQHNPNGNTASHNDSSHNPSPSSSRTSSPASTPPFRKHITEIMKPQKSNSFLSIPALVGGGGNNNANNNTTGNEGLRQRLGSGGARA